MFSKKTTNNRRWSIGLSLLAIGLTFGTGVILWHVMEDSSLTVIIEQVSQLKPIAGTFRLLLIGALAALWPNLVDLMHYCKRIDSAEQSELLTLRWRVVTWLLIVELMMGQDLLNRSITLLRSATP